MEGLADGSCVIALTCNHYSRCVLCVDISYFLIVQVLYGVIASL